MWIDLRVIVSAIEAQELQFFSIIGGSVNLDGMKDPSLVLRVVNRRIAVGVTYEAEWMQNCFPP